MPNAKNLNPLKKNILNIGPTGSGKTTLFTTIPGKKFIYMFDPSGLGSIQGQDIDYEYFSPDSNIGLRRGMKGQKDPKATKPKEPLAYANFEDHLEDMIANGFYDYDVVGFDSLTKLQDIMMDRQLWINSRYGQIPELGDYRVIGITMVTIFTEVVTHRPVVYITGHTDTTKDEISGRVIDQFDIVKNLRRQLPRDLTDMWVSSAEQRETGSKYMIQTAPDKRNPNVKNSFRLKFTEDVTIDFKKPRDSQGIGEFFKRINK
jgi:hypothetical protein